MKLRYSLDRAIRIISCGCFFDVICDVLWRFEIDFLGIEQNINTKKHHGWMTFHNHQNQRQFKVPKQQKSLPVLLDTMGWAGRCFKGFFCVPCGHVFKKCSTKNDPMSNKSVKGIH